MAHEIERGREKARTNQGAVSRHFATPLAAKNTPKPEPGERVRRKSDGEIFTVTKIDALGIQLAGQTGYFALQGFTIV